MPHKLYYLSPIEFQPILDGAHARLDLSCSVTESLYFLLGAIVYSPRPSLSLLQLFRLRFMPLIVASMIVSMRSNNAKTLLDEPTLTR